MNREQAVELATNRSLELIRGASWSFNKAVGYTAQMYKVDFSEIVREMNRRRKIKVVDPSQLTLNI